jgi:hypothetical protein
LVKVELMCLVGALEYAPWVLEAYLPMARREPRPIK